MTAASQTSTQRFLLPDLGEGLTDAELVSWQVQVGDTVRLNQTLCEVETAKALVELPSPFAGTVTELLVAQGQIALVGDALIAIAVEGAAGEDTPVADRAAPETAGSATSGVGLLVGTGPLAHRPSRLHHSGSATPAKRSVSGTPASPGRRAAKPAARKLARELGVDLDALAGSGAAGVITVDDVRAQVAGNAGERRIPVRGVHRAMAEAVALSARTIPQSTVFLTVDVTASMALLRDLQGEYDYREIKLTPLALVAYSLLAAVRQHPDLNSTWDQERLEIIEKPYVNLGIAVASERGLLVPNIKDADQLGLAGLARELEALAESARTGRTLPADLAGGTISITNVGVFGVDAGTPILNHGEAAILCLGSIAKRPWVHHDELAVREVTMLGLTFDHRVADGAQASRLLAAIGAGLANPLRLIG